jgi:hypothetical protein
VNRRKVILFSSFSLLEPLGSLGSYDALLRKKGDDVQHLTQGLLGVDVRYIVLGDVNEENNYFS